ncbi:MAG: hypothetical protein KA077_00485 [Veillonella sp.]|nr:hypothetical protein [Veillonella sp.]
MNSVSKKVVAVTLSVFTFLPSMPVFAEAQLQQVEKAPGTAPTESNTLSQRVAEITGRQTVTHMPENEAYIPAGITLRVEVPEELSSKKNKKGSALKFTLLDNVIINGVIVIPSGSVVTGRVTDQRSSGMFGRSGKLEISVDNVRTINNIDVPLEYVGRIEAGSDGGAVAVATVVSLVGGLFMKGKNVTIPAGTQLQVKVKSDTDLKVKLDELATAMDPNVPHGVSITLK